MRWPTSRPGSQVGKSYGMYEAAASLHSAGADIIHLGVGRPSGDTPMHIKEAAKSALDAGIVHYGELQGLGSLRAALAARYTREHGVDYSAEEILITNGVTQASFAAILAALDPVDEVIVLDPFYPQHNSKIVFAGGRVVPVPFQLSDGMFRLDADAVKKSISAATLMIILVNPANPIRTVYTQEELQQLARIATDHDLIVLSDEVYEFITFDNNKHITFASLAGIKERTIAVSAFTKAYAMDGWRIGCAAAPQPNISDLPRVTMNCTTHPCIFAQEGALTAVTASQDCLRQMVDEDRVRRDLVLDSLNAIPGISCIIPQGIIYPYPDVSGLGIDSAELAQQILVKTHVAVESGTLYSQNGNHHLSVCFDSEPDERLFDALKRLSAYLTGMQGP